MLGRRLAALAAAAQPQGRRVRLAPRRAPRAAVRARRRPARRAGVRRVGAVHRPQHRKLVRRARRPRARRRPGAGPEDARLPAQGLGQQGDPDGGHARREPGQPRAARCRARPSRRTCTRRRSSRRPGAVLAVAGTGGARTTPEPPPPSALRLARLQQPYSKIEQAPDGGLILRVVVPVNTEDTLNPLRLLQIIEPVPKSLAQDAERVQAGVRDYQELSFSRTALKRLYALTLTLTLLLALTSALGLAVVLSERFAAPLGLLAEGTRAVAQGDFTRRQPVVSRDELGVLTESFNTMTAQLAEARGREQDSRRAIETTRAYLESVLGNLSAGVLVFDEGHRLRMVNPSAAVILQQPAGRPDRHAARRLGQAASRARAVRRARRGGLSREPRPAMAARGRSLGGQPFAHAPDARHAAARDDDDGRLRRRVRRRVRAGAGAARRRVGRSGAPPRARDQESADADPALGGASCRQARGAARRARTRRRCGAARRPSFRRSPR